MPPHDDRPASRTSPDAERDMILPPIGTSSSGPPPRLPPLFAILPDFEPWRPPPHQPPRDSRPGQNSMSQLSALSLLSAPTYLQRSHLHQLPPFRPLPSSSDGRRREQLPSIADIFWSSSAKATSLPSPLPSHQPSPTRSPGTTRTRRTDGRAGKVATACAECHSRKQRVSQNCWRDLI